jgi:hypothetical protein
VAEFSPATTPCFIDAADFPGPEALARHLEDLDEEEAAYARLLAWKHQGLRPDFVHMAERAGRWDVEPFEVLARMLA